MILHHTLHYFSRTVNREVKEVYWFSSIYALAVALIFIFEPIYLYKAGFDVIHILLFYLLVYFGYSTFIFLAAPISSRIGYKHSILISTFFYVAYWTILFNIARFPELFFVAPFLYSLQKSFFWPPYDSDIALASAKVQRGREIGVLFSLVEIFSIVGPFLGGFISAAFGFKALFILAGTLLVSSTYPLFSTPDIYPKHEFEFKNFVDIFNRYKQNFLGYWGYAEDLMIMSIWPIVIFLTVTNVIWVGTVSTFASVVSSVLMLYIGRLTDKTDKLKIIKVVSRLYGLTWIFRFLAQGLAGILGFDILTKTGRASVSVPVVSLTYEIAGSGNANHAIAYSVFYEFSIAVGNSITCLVGITLLSFTDNIYLVFAFAGIMTMLFGLLRKKQTKFI